MRKMEREDFYSWKTSESLSLHFPHKIKRKRGAFRYMKLLCISLGCDKNLVDTEKMLGLFRQNGWEFTDDETEADAVLVNTCCFIGDAKEESVNTILEMAELKKEGNVKALLVIGKRY